MQSDKSSAAPKVGELSHSHLQMRWAELLVAAFFIAVGAVVVFDSFRTGFRWAADGPQPGYFPFYIGITMIATAGWLALKILREWKTEGGKKVFAAHHEFKLVLRMFIPICLYVIGVVFLGIYVSSTIYISAFMVWEGKFSWMKSIAVGLGVAAFLFLMFEIWFLVPLPKGPLEAGLGI
jgi:putative tricarboxylic transport membrane protein